MPLPNHILQAKLTGNTSLLRRGGIRSQQVQAHKKLVKQKMWESHLANPENKSIHDWHEEDLSKQADASAEFRRLVLNRMLSINKPISPTRQLFQNAITNPNGNGVFTAGDKVLGTTMVDPKTRSNFTAPNDLNPVNTALALRQVRNRFRTNQIQ